MLPTCAFLTRFNTDLLRADDYFNTSDLKRKEVISHNLGTRGVGPLLGGLVEAGLIRLKKERERESERERKREKQSKNDHCTATPITRLCAHQEGRHLLIPDTHYFSPCFFSLVFFFPSADRKARRRGPCWQGRRKCRSGAS